MNTGDMAMNEDPMDLDMGDDMDSMDDNDVGSDADLDLGDSVEEDDMGVEDEGEVTASKSRLRELFQSVADGSMPPDEAMDECCSGLDLDDGDDEVSMDDMAGMADMDMEDLGDEPETDVVAGESKCGPMYENVQKIADLLTDDPDIFAK